MEQNPYESPTSSAEPPARRGRILLFRVLAVPLWVFSFYLLIAFWMVRTTPRYIERRTSDPALFWWASISLLVLPAFGIAVLGIASWWRLRRIAYVGLAFFAPIIVTVLYLAIRKSF